MTQNEIRTYSSDESLVKERRDLIRREATKLFIRQGYSRTTMRQIAEACGLKHGTLYHYLGGKADILQLFVSTEPELVQSMEDSIKQWDGLSHTEILERVIRKHISTVDDWNDYIVFVFTQMGVFRPADIEKMRKDAAYGLHLIERAIVGGVEAGKFHTDDPLWIAFTIHELGLSWAMRGWFIREKYTLEEYVRKVTETAFTLLGVSTS